MMMYQAENGPLQIRIALLGNPCNFPEWSEEQLAALVRLGFNAIQLNIAWLRRPNDEALNLCDVVTVPGEAELPRVAERRAELKRRAALAKQFGLRLIFHFGSPFMWRNPYSGEVQRNGTHDSPNVFLTEDPWFDTLNPLVVEHELKLLREFRRQFPEVEDILVYTYDQDTWKPSEFGYSKFSRGIPLHERLPEYIAALHQVWTEGRAERSVMWWEPWELSAGQIFKCLPQLPRQGLGLMLHSNIAEAQLTRPVDVWFRNTARMAQELGMPVVGEGFFCSMTEEIEPLCIPCPRLVDEELAAITSVPGVVGVKEYFGLLPLEPDFNLELFGMRLEHPDASLADLMNDLTKRFGARQGEVRQMLGQLADALQFFPWDASWFARLAGTADIDHGWAAATVRGQMCETPSWESTRRSHFMMTEDHQPHPFLLEDVQLRCEMAADCLEQALRLCRALQEGWQESELADDGNKGDPIATRSGEASDAGVQMQVCRPAYGQETFAAIERDVDRFLRVVRSYALHLRETNVAMLLRQDLEAGRPLPERQMQEMDRLLSADVANQHGTGRVVGMYNLFKENPERFLRTWLLPTDKTVIEKGYHTMTTR